jgi:hypothetical protein
MKSSDKKFYLVKDNGKVRIFYSENEMEVAGFTKAGLAVSEEKFNSNGCYARLVDGIIVVGKTDDEIAEEEKQAEIADCKTQLDAIDSQAGIGRTAREACMALDSIRVLMGVTDQQISTETDPAKKKALQTLKQFDFAINTGLEKLTALETEAQPIRERLSALLND